MIKKISYSEFIREVESNILDFMPEDFANAEVSVRKVTKVNVDKYALNIRRTNEKISPTLYLDSFYKEGKYLNDTLKLIADTYVDYVNDSTINFRNINVVDKFLDVKNIIFSLINAEKNAEHRRIAKKQKHLFTGRVCRRHHENNKRHKHCT